LKRNWKSCWIRRRRRYYYYYKMNTTLNLFNKEQTSQLRKFGEQIAEEMGIPPSPLKGRRDN